MDELMTAGVIQKVTENSLAAIQKARILGTRLTRNPQLENAA